MERWTIENPKKDISAEQFVDLTRNFKEAVEKSFGADFKLSIKAYSSLKLSPVYDEGLMNICCDAFNEDNMICETDSPEKIAAMWDQAKHIEIILKPRSDSEKLKAAFVHAEFKGDTPKQALFYVQPKKEGVKDAMLAKHENKPDTIPAYLSQVITRFSGI